MQVGIARHRHRNHLGDHLPVLLHRHCQRRAGRVVVEGDPADMPRLESLSAAIADAGATDDGLQIGHGLVRGVAVGLPDSGLLGRRGERPGNRHALVRRQGEVVGADGNQLFRLPGALVGDGAHFGIVLALDLLTVGPPPGQHRADLFPGRGPLGVEAQALGHQRVQVVPQVHRCFAGLRPGHLRPLRVVASEVRNLLRQGLRQVMVGDSRRRGGFPGGDGRKGQDGATSGTPLGVSSGAAGSRRR